MRFRRRRIIAAVVAISTGFVIAGLLYHPTLGAFNRLVRLPRVVYASFVEDLSESAEVAMAQRLRLLESWQTRGDYGLHRVQKTVEGTPVGLWLITSGGSLTLVTDYTRDSYSTRGIYVSTPSSLELGTPTRQEQHPLRAWFPDREQTYLRCIFGSGGVEFF
jgi:hypothetical protein